MLARTIPNAITLQLLFTYGLPSIRSSKAINFNPFDVIEKKVGAVDQIITLSNSHIVDKLKPTFAILKSFTIQPKV